MARRITPDDPLRLQLVGDPQLSPDGKWVAYVTARIHKEKNEYRHRIYMMAAIPGAPATPITAGTGSDKNPRWSPDGTQLAFISDRSGKNQLWLISSIGGEARQLTRFKEGVNGPAVWSPDGRDVAVTAAVGESGPGSSPHDIEDSEGFFDPAVHEQVFIIATDAEAPPPRQITAGPWNHTDPAWAPDGRAIAFLANRRADDDCTPFLRQIWIQAVGGETAPVSITPGTFSIRDVAWSPDGASLAFLGYPREPRPGYSSVRLYVVSRNGSGLRQLATEWDHTFEQSAIAGAPAPSGGRLSWTPDGTALVTIGSDSGRQQIYAIDTESGDVTPLTAGDHCVTSWSLDRGCRQLVVSLTRPGLPSDIFLIEGPDLFRLTNG